MKIGEGHRLVVTAADGQKVSVPFEHSVVANWLRYQPAILEDDSWAAYQGVADLDEGDTVFRRAQLIPLVPMLRSLADRGQPGLFVEIAPQTGTIDRMTEGWLDRARLWAGDLKFEPQDRTAADDPPPGYVDYFGLRQAGGHSPHAAMPNHPALSGNAATLAAKLPERIVFARLCGCFAAPTEILLMALLARLAPGGVILASDYDYADYPGATAVIDRMLALRRDGLFMPLPLGGALWLQG